MLLSPAMTLVIKMESGWSWSALSWVPQLYCIHYQSRGWGPWLDYSQILWCDVVTEGEEWKLNFWDPVVPIQRKPTFNATSPSDISRLHDTAVGSLLGGLCCEFCKGTQKHLRLVKTKSILQFLGLSHSGAQRTCVQTASVDHFQMLQYSKYNCQDCRTKY